MLASHDAAQSTVDIAAAVHRKTSTHKYLCCSEVRSCVVSCPHQIVCVMEGRLIHVIQLQSS